MDPIDTVGSTASSAANAAQTAADNQAFQAEFDRLTLGMAQGVMSIVLEEMQQMATSEE